MGDNFEAAAIEKFRDYIRIKTVQPNPDYASAVLFFQKYATELNMEFKTFEAVQGKPLILMCMRGVDGHLPSILLNSHMDVVPVFEDHWTYPPFEGHMDEGGDIYGRGTQDMKCVTIQYLEALRLLKKDSFVPKRTIYVSIVPDEEIGGGDGMGAFVESDDFKQLNVGFSLDEGLATETDVNKVFYAERKVYWIEITCSGNPGHGSLLIENTAAEKMRRIIDVFLAYRDDCVQKAAEENLALGSRQTINLTVISGGVQTNVVPSSFKIEFDLRVLPEDDGRAIVERLVEEAAVDVDVKFMIEAIPRAIVTDTTDNNPYWKSMRQVFVELGLKYELEVFVGATDARFLRLLGIPAIGFSPMTHTKILLHDHDEKLNKAVFTQGIHTYKPIIAAIANC